MAVLNESNVIMRVIGSKIDKFTSMLGKLSIQNRQSKSFKPRVSQVEAEL